MKLPENEEGCDDHYNGGDNDRNEVRFPQRDGRKKSLTNSYNVIRTRVDNPTTARVGAVAKCRERGARWPRPLCPRALSIKRCRGGIGRVRKLPSGPEMPIFERTNPRATTNSVLRPGSLFKQTTAL